MKFHVYCLIVVVLLCLQACNKKTVSASEPETGTVTDVQGHVYGTVKIGDQWWMSENLRVTVFNDSTPIQEILPDSVFRWKETTQPAFCRLDNRYGLHYNWMSVAGSHQLAPAGWHVPTDAEWMELERNLGMSADDCEATGWRGTSECAKLLPDASVGWPGEAQAKVYGNNSSGFSALPGGCRLFNGGVGDVSASAYFWCASARDATTAWYRNLSADHAQLYRYATYKTYGFTVRCVRNAP